MAQQVVRAGSALAGQAVLVALLLATAAAGHSAEPEPVAAPDFALKTTTGQNLRLSEFRGQTVVLSFWADWCGACRNQLDELAGLARRLPAADVAVLTVNIDTRDDAAGAAAARLGLPVLRDRTQAVARQFDLGNLPLILLIDADGRVRHSYTRYRPGTTRDLEADLGRLVAASQ